jgi:phosphoribosyl-ATP pyrophosphohydrolase/phosphoribosyl-AMP cyclohydrolase/histidinol dehydrogenase
MDRAMRPSVDSQALAAAREILRECEEGGDDAVLRIARRFGDIPPEAPAVYERPALRRALDSIPARDRRILEQGAERVAAFASSQRAALRDIDVPVPGGRAGHRVLPVATAGCYAPGGRYPLPSSVLMTAVTARAAGVERVWVASPRPTPVTLAAAAIANADALVPLGGAQAIAAFVHGFRGLPPCDTVAGPGNKYVAAAKSLVSDRVRIDMLAGPSEVLIIADDSADPRLVAADLLAQAEHDDDAVPQLLTTHAPLLDAVDAELERQLTTLPTAPTARRALENSAACVVESLDAACVIADRLAPEHLQLMTREDDRLAARLRSYGALFIGPRTAETLGDYALGPNHTLPTGGTARSTSGLSVFTFLAVRTWLRLDADAPDTIYEDAASFARLEGLEGHARASLARTGSRAR